jgi:hypothetical protein
MISTNIIAAATEAQIAFLTEVLSCSMAAGAIVTLLLASIRLMVSMVGQRVLSNDSGGGTDSDDEIIAVSVADEKVPVLVRIARAIARR